MQWMSLNTLSLNTLSVKNRIFGQLALAAMLFLTACTNSGGGFPRVANPPEFDFVDGEELRTGMHQLAFELQKLDLMLLSENDDLVNDSQNVVTSLRTIERIAGTLREGDINSQHPFLRRDMDIFLADVVRAREDAMRGQTSFYLAGRVSGSCVSCHRAND